jgi:sugar O-acyltransferase (sialic acid O-acetyltransferase NeuD family)
MTELIIVSAGGLAREVLASLRLSGRSVRGFVDDDPTLAGEVVNDVPVLGRIAELTLHPEVSVVVALGRGVVRRSVVARLRHFGVGDERHATIIDPSVVVPPTCTVGRGSILLAGTVLTSDVTVGRHVVIMPRVTLTHDVVVEDFATLCAGVSLGGGVRIGPAAYLGMNAAVREGRAIGADATLGMGAAAIMDVPAGEVWVGVPARPLERRAPLTRVADGTAAARW